MYSNLKVTRNPAAETGTVSFIVENTGKVDGAEVAQLYLSFPASSGEPPLQLKGFKKTRVLGPSEKEEVSISLRKRDFSIWDSKAHAWSQVAGTFKIMVGSSSRDIRLEGSVTLPQNPGSLGILADLAERLFV